MKRFLFYITLLFALTSCIEGLKGRVVAVSDGDTFTLLTLSNEQHKVRLHGVDCPEKVQPYGQKAKEFTSSLIFGKEVVVEATDTDRYGRVVGIVYVDTIVLNEELLSAGYAWHYKQYDSSQRYALLEAEARAQRKGLWAEAYPVAPGDFRKGKKYSASTTESKTKPAAYVLVCSNGKSYHTSKCSIAARCSSTSKYSEKEAKAKGFKPCKQCH